MECLSLFSDLHTAAALAKSMLRNVLIFAMCCAANTERFSVSDKLSFQRVWTPFHFSGNVAEKSDNSAEV